MPEFSAVAAAFILGLAGAGHCLGMCGGILSALSFGAGGEVRLHLLAAYNIGRIASYATIGALVGALAAVAPTTGLPLARTLAGLVLVFMGLYIAGWGNTILVLERAGSGLWRKLKPLANRFLPVRSLGSALMIGALWGWLPCGLVYSALVYAASQGTTFASALTMAAFGLGTLPAMVAGGWLLQRLRAQLQKRWWRSTLGVAYIVFGVWTAVVSWGHLFVGHGGS